MIRLNLLNRNTMAATLPKGGIVAEIGVQKGHYSKIILEHNRPSMLHLIDCWEHQPDEIYGSDPANMDHDAQDKYYELVRMKFATQQNVHIVRKYSKDAVLRYADLYFDWIYIDSNHLRISEDIKLWWPKVKHTGWLSGHDYCTNAFTEVEPVIERFVDDNGLSLFLTEEPPCPSWIIQKP